VIDRAALPAKARPRWLSLAAAGAVLALMSGAVAATIHVLHLRALSKIELPRMTAPPRVAEPAPAAVPVVEEPSSLEDATPLSELQPGSVPKPEAPARIHSTVPAADLLAQANRLRGDKRWKDAERVYARVLRAFPDGSDAPVAAIAAGSLLLEHLDSPRDALDMFSTGPALQSDRPARRRGALGHRAGLRRARRSPRRAARARSVPAPTSAVGSARARTSAALRAQDALTHFSVSAPPST
jgi:hypothetical protein